MLSDLASKRYNVHDSSGMNIYTLTIQYDFSYRAVTVIVRTLHQRYMPELVFGQMLAPYG